MSGHSPLRWEPVHHRQELLAEPVRDAVLAWRYAGEVEVAQIDPSLADTQALTDAYGLDPTSCANCVVVAGRRDGVQRVAACVVLASTRADVNNLVKRTLDVRKASFLAMDEAVEGTGMEYGGITPVGLPPAWRLLVDQAAATTARVIIGSGVRRSKLRLPGPLLAELPGAQVLSGLGLPVGT